MAGLVLLTVFLTVLDRGAAGWLVVLSAVLATGAGHLARRALEVRRLRTEEPEVGMQGGRR